MVMAMSGDPQRVLAQVFHECQSSQASHRKNVIVVHRLLHQCRMADMEGDVAMSPTKVSAVTWNEFVQAYLTQINVLLASKKRGPSVERVIKFIVHFIKYAIQKDGVTDDRRISLLAHALLRHLLQGVRAKEKWVRCRVCQLIALILNELQEVDDDIWNRIQIDMTERLRDKEAMVRCQAICALSRMQTDESQDAVSLEILQLLAQDPRAEVRRTALANLHATPALLPFVLARQHDTDPRVRRLFYEHILRTCPLLSPADRTQSLLTGIHDNGQPRRQQSCIRMLVDTYRTDPPQLLRDMDVFSQYALCEKALLALLQHTSPPFSMPITDALLDELTPESAFFLRVYLQSLREQADARLIAVAKQPSSQTDTHAHPHSLPQEDSDMERDASQISSPEDALELGRLCRAIQHYHTQMMTASSNTEEEDHRKLVCEFILNELLRASQYLDLSDEVGRRQLFLLVHETLTRAETSPDLLPTLMDVLMHVTGTATDFTQAVTRIMEALCQAGRDPSMTSSSTNEMTDTVQEALGLCLFMLHACLERLPGVTPGTHPRWLQRPLEQYVYPALQHSAQPLVRALAMQCLYQCALMDAAKAPRIFGLVLDHLLSSAQEEADEENTRRVACQCLMDLLLLYGASLFRSSPLKEDMNSHGMDPVMVLQQRRPVTAKRTLRQRDKTMLSAPVDDDVTARFGLDSEQYSAYRTLIQWLLQQWEEASQSGAETLSMDGELADVIQEGLVRCLLLDVALPETPLIVWSFFQRTFLAGQSQASLAFFWHVYRVHHGEALFQLFPLLLLQCAHKQRTDAVLQLVALLSTEDSDVAARLALWILQHGVDDVQSPYATLTGVLARLDVSGCRESARIHELLMLCDTWKTTVALEPARDREFVKFIVHVLKVDEQLQQRKESPTTTAAAVVVGDA